METGERIESGVVCHFSYNLKPGTLANADFDVTLGERATE